MRRSLVYLVGEPGVGKSTAMAAATEGWDRLEVARPLAHDVLFDRRGVPVAVELGKRRGTFSGTDALGMSAVVPAEAYLEAPEAPVVLGEGARLGVKRFLVRALELGYAVTLVHLVSPRAAAQRAARGAGQTESWVKGAATRAANLYAAAPAGVRKVLVDGSRQDAAAVIRELVAQSG